MPTYDFRVLRAWHADSGKTLEEVAYRAQVSYIHLRRLQGPGANPSAALLARLASVYGRSLDELFTPGPDPARAR